MSLLTRWALAGGEGHSPEGLYRALKRLENVLGRTPVWTASRAVTASTTLTDSDDLLLVDTTGGAVTVTLPPAANATGRRYTVKKTNAGALNTILDGNGAEIVDGAANVTWNTQYMAKTVQSDGTTWWVIFGP